MSVAVPGLAPVERHLHCGHRGVGRFPRLLHDTPRKQQIGTDQAKTELSPSIAISLTIGRCHAK